jgi:hypothetical protein
MVDVTVLAPAAVGGLKVPEPGHVFDPPTAEELCRLYTADNNRMRRELRELGDTASSISSVALGLFQLLVDYGHGNELDEITVPKELYHRMHGASITLSNDILGNVTVRLKQRGRERVAVD